MSIGLGPLLLALGESRATLWLPVSKGTAVSADKSEFYIWKYGSANEGKVKFSDSSHSNK